MSDWDENEILFKINPAEFLRLIEIEANLRYNQDKKITVKKELNKNLLFERGFISGPVIVKDKPWIQYVRQPGGNIIYKML